MKRGLARPATVRGARAWQTVHRTTSLLTGTACVVTIVGAVQDALGPDYTYERASVEVLVAVATLVAAAFSGYAAMVYATKEMDLRDAGQDDTDRWLPPDEVPNAEGLRQLNHVFRRSAGIAAVLMAAFLLTADVDAAAWPLLPVSLWFMAVAARWRAWFREVARTGWRRAEVLRASPAGVVICYEDCTEITLSAVLTVRGWKWRGLDADVWVGGAGKHMVVLFPRGRWRDRLFPVPARALTERREPAGPAVSRVNPRRLAAKAQQAKPSTAPEDWLPPSPFRNDEAHLLVRAQIPRSIAGVLSYGTLAAAAIAMMMVKSEIAILTAFLSVVVVVLLAITVAYVVATVNWWRRYRSVSATDWCVGEAELRNSGRLATMTIIYSDQSQVLLRQASTSHGCEPGGVLFDDQLVWVGGAGKHIVVFFPDGRTPGQPSVVPAAGVVSRKSPRRTRHASGRRPPRKMAKRP